MFSGLFGCFTGRAGEPGRHGLGLPSPAEVAAPPKKPQPDPQDSDGSTISSSGAGTPACAAFGSPATACDSSDRHWTLSSVARPTQQHHRSSCTLSCAVPGRPLELPTSPSPALILSLHNLHLASISASPSYLLNESPSGERPPQPFSTAVRPASGAPPPLHSFPSSLRLTTTDSLADEVQDLQLLGRGGYGMVLLGTWRQEGRVAVKVLLSDEDKWMDSCFKEAVVSKALAHPNVLQTYDFKAAVVSELDVAKARAAWELQQQRSQDALSLSGSSRLPQFVEARADSFEMLSPPDTLGCSSRAGGCPASIDLWQVLFMLGARPGQFLTLIVMEYAEVGTLQRAIAAGAFRESQRLNKWVALRSLLATAKEVAGAMCMLHSLNIIHGDLSATNVMLRCSRIDKRGFVAKVADFGLSKVTLSGVARTDDWAGQAQYMAPECLDYEARLASDVFSFGVLLFECVSGQLAFSEFLPAQILVGRLTGDLPLHWPADAPPELRALAERCMQQDPDARPSFREVVEALRRMDGEARAQHRLHSARRRSTADGMAAAMAASAAAAAARRLGLHRLASTAIATAPAGRAPDSHAASLTAAQLAVRSLQQDGSSDVMAGASGAAGAALCCSSLFTGPLGRTASTLGSSSMWLLGGGAQAVHAAQLALAEAFAADPAPPTPTPGGCGAGAAGEAAVPPPASRRCTAAAGRALPALQPFLVDVAGPSDTARRQ